MRNKGGPRLKRCPFCGNPNVAVVKYAADGIRRYRDRYAVLCDYTEYGCGAESGHYHSAEEAEEAWNQRRRRWEHD